jgi:hypothetical protein
MVNRRTFLRFVAGSSISLALHLIAFSENKSSNKPNFILCMADDMGWGDPGFNGILSDLFSTKYQICTKSSSS